MPRHRWKPQSRQGRSSTWNDLEPLAAPPLSRGEIQDKRLELVEELLALVVQDGAGLPRPIQRQLQASYQTLQQIRAETSRLPTS